MLLLTSLTTVGFDRAEATLSLVQETSCPRFHADYVEVCILQHHLAGGAVQLFLVLAAATEQQLGS